MLFEMRSYSYFYCALIYCCHAAAISAIALLFSTLILFGCSDPEPLKPTKISHKPREQGPIHAIIETSRGTCTLELAHRDAPRLSANFANLVQRQFFDGLTFYRSSSVMRQAGNPYNREGQYFDPGYRLLPEFAPNLTFSEGGVVAMLLWGDDNLADVRPTEFFITVKAQDRWTFKYPIFARVVEGNDVILSLEDGDLIQSVRLQGDPTPLLNEHSDLLTEWNSALDQSPPPKPAP